MNPRKALIALSLCFMFTIVASAAFAQTGGATPAPPPMTFGLSGICVDQSGTYLYVLAGGKILQYTTGSWTTPANQVDLPVLTPPVGAPPPKPADGKFPPPPHMGGAPHGLAIDSTNGYLYVLAGPVVYRYIIPGLTLDESSKIELPRPEPPKVSQ
ncbi:MAG: hypothetical protein ABFD97_13460 [Syntrophobacter sp.]